MDRTACWATANPTALSTPTTLLAPHSGTAQQTQGEDAAQNKPLHNSPNEENPRKAEVSKVEPSGVEPPTS